MASVGRWQAGTLEQWNSSRKTARAKRERNRARGEKKGRVFRMERGKRRREEREGGKEK